MHFWLFDALQYSAASSHLYFNENETQIRLALQSIRSNSDKFRLCIRDLEEGGCGGWTVAAIHWIKEFPQVYFGLGFGTFWVFNNNNNNKGLFSQQ